MPKRGQSNLGRVPVIDVRIPTWSRVVGFAMKVMEENGLALLVNLSGEFASKLSRHAAGSAVAQGRILSFSTLPTRGLMSLGGGARGNQLKLAVDEYGYRGLKISKALGLGVRLEGGPLLPVDDGILDPLWEMAGILGVPVAIHTGDPRAFWETTTLRMTIR